MWEYRVVPISVEFVALDSNRGHLFVRNLHPLWVFTRIDFGMDAQPGSGRCGGNQIHNHLVADQRFAAPVLADEREQSVFNFIPLTGPRWQMTDRDLQSGLVGQLLQFPFPQTHSNAVTPAGISRDQQSRRLGIGLVPHRFPPSPDALGGKGGRVMIHPHAHPSRILGHVVNPIGSRPPQFRNDKIVHTHLLRVSLRPQLPPVVFEVAHQFLLLRIHGNDGLAIGLKFPDPIADMVKLRIPVGVRRSLQRFAVGLQTILHAMQDLGHHPVTGPMPHAVQLGSQLTHALTCPAQRRLRVTARHRFDEGLQIPLQGRVLVNRPLSACPLAPDSLTACRFRRGLEFGHAADYSPAGQSAGPSHRRDSAETNGFSFSRCDQTPRAFVQDTRENVEFIRQASGVWHRCQYRTLSFKMFYLFCDSSLVSRNASESSASWLRRSLLATIRSPFVIAFRFLRARCKTTDRQQLAIKITFCVRGVVSSLLANVYLHYVFDLWADVVPRESVIAFREEMRLAQANWQINIYGEAKHSFTGEGAVGNRTPEAGLHPQTEARSWQTTVEFL